jgi:hypothetical protein
MVCKPLLSDCSKGDMHQLSARTKHGLCPVHCMEHIRTLVNQRRHLYISEEKRKSETQEHMATPGPL